MDGLFSLLKLCHRAPYSRVASLRVVAPFDVVEHAGPSWSRAVDLSGRALGFQRGNRALHRGVVAGIAGSTHAASHSVIRDELPELLAALLGPFNWSPQHAWKECWNGRSASVGSCIAEQAAFARTTSGCAAGASAAVPCFDCDGVVERGCGSWHRSVASNRSAVVSGGRRQGAIDAGAFAIAAGIGIDSRITQRASLRRPGGSRR